MWNSGRLAYASSVSTIPQFVWGRHGNKKLHSAQYQWMYAPNWLGGCAVMALGTLAPEVLKSGIDSSGLGQWCWIWVGSGSKKMHIVMAYQPSNSGRSAGTTVKDQHSWHFGALRDARSPQMIFYERGWLNVHCVGLYYSNWIHFLVMFLRVPSIDSMCFPHT